MIFSKYKKILLDPTFAIGHPGSVTIPHTVNTFKGGEENFKITDTTFLYDNDSVLIVSRANSSSEVMRILMANDALKQIAIDDNITINVSLFIPYLPYARQDAVMVKGEALSIRVFANLINMCNFNKVYVIDPHSGVGTALLNNCKIMTREYLTFVSSALVHLTFDSNTNFNINRIDKDSLCLVSPDAGAYKKIYKTAEAIGFRGDIILCNKVRNLETREIVNLSVDGDVKDKVCVIIDDICDGGRTFAELGKKLKEKGARLVVLIVTHGIFSYGDTQLVPFIDHVWSTDSFREYESDYVTFIKINNL